MSRASKSSFELAVTTMMLVAWLAVVVGQTFVYDAVAKGAYQQKTHMDLVDTAVKAGSFKTLVAAVKAAGLVETLKAKGPFIVVAPTDEAFAKLPAGNVETLLKPENKDKLIAILGYHVVAAKVKAADVVKLKSAETVQGQSVAIDAKDDVNINNAKVVKADIDCGNRVIHVIDTVLLPKK